MISNHKSCNLLSYCNFVFVREKDDLLKKQHAKNTRLFFFLAQHGFDSTITSKFSIMKIYNICMWHIKDSGMALNQMAQRMKMQKCKKNIGVDLKLSPKAQDLLMQIKHCLKKQRAIPVCGLFFVFWGEGA